MRFRFLALFLLLSPGLAHAQLQIEVLHRRPLAEAARDGNLDVLRAQIAANVSPNQQDLEFRPAIVNAAANGHTEAVRMLLEAKANPDYRDRVTRTALMWAAERGHVGPVQQLIAGKANVNLDERGSGMTALMIAAREGHLPIVEALVRAGADMKVADVTGRTALALAESANRRQVVEFLRRNNAPR
ncbi:MAG: ankyrin repeat domain-containing protein [Proteobacteria bacterium]|nr:ankyrin repeat domain-containing protein [Pseudomonadota bacterium]